MEQYDNFKTLNKSCAPIIFIYELCIAITLKIGAILGTASCLVCIKNSKKRVSNFAHSFPLNFILQLLALGQYRINIKPFPLL